MTVTRSHLLYVPHIMPVVFSQAWLLVLCSVLEGLRVNQVILLYFFMAHNSRGLVPAFPEGFITRQQIADDNDLGK